jgi:hypothetical protein
VLGTQETFCIVIAGLLESRGGHKNRKPKTETEETETETEETETVKTD